MLQAKNASIAVFRNRGKASFFVYLTVHMPLPAGTYCFRQVMTMMICQLKQRVRMPVERPLIVQDVAVLYGGTGEVPLNCPKKQGVWKIYAADVAFALAQACPDAQVQMLGADACYVHRVHQKPRDMTKYLRGAIAFLVLLLGSALGLCWFHSDVGMPQAQVSLYHTLTGQEPENRQLITIPYALGVAVGVVVFYALPGRKEITPMEVKLMDYEEDMERARGKDVQDA